MNAGSNDNARRESVERQLEEDGRQERRRFAEPMNTPTPTPRTDGLTVKAPDIQYYIPPTQPSYIPPTQRERIAVAAMQGMLAGRQAALDTPYVVHRSMEIADALIRVLNDTSP